MVLTVFLKTYQDWEIHLRNVYVWVFQVVCTFNYYNGEIKGKPGLGERFFVSILTFSIFNINSKVNVRNETVHTNVLFRNRPSIVTKKP